MTGMASRDKLLSYYSNAYNYAISIQTKSKPSAMILIRLLLISLLVSPVLVNATQFYRWIDENGNTVIQGYIPPEYVKKGYEVIDDRGNVIKQVAPEISETERRANEAARISSEMQQARDDELLKLYRSPTDVDRAMKTWLSRMDMEIRVKQNRIRIKQNEFDTLQERAASQEKAGKDVDSDLLAQMESIKREIQQFNAEISDVQARQEESRTAFMKDRKRMVTLWEIMNKKTWTDEPVASETIDQGN